MIDFNLDHQPVLKWWAISLDLGDLLTFPDTDLYPYTLTLIILIMRRVFNLSDLCRSMVYHHARPYFVNIPWSAWYSYKYFQSIGFIDGVVYFWSTPPVHTLLTCDTDPLVTIML